MANLGWNEVLIISGVATVAFTLLSFWFSGIMSRRGWSWQVRSKPKKRPAPPPAPPAPPARPPQ